MIQNVGIFPLAQNQIKLIRTSELRGSASLIFQEITKLESNVQDIANIVLIQYVSL